VARGVTPAHGVAAEVYPIMTEGVALWNAIKVGRCRLTPD